MRQGEREVVVVFEEVEYRAREEACHDADVVPVVEAVDEVNAFAESRLERVAYRQPVRTYVLIAEGLVVAHLMLEGSRSRSKFSTLISTLLASLHRTVKCVSATGQQRTETASARVGDSPILLYRANDLDRNKAAIVPVPCLYYFAECPLA